MCINYSTVQFVRSYQIAIFLPLFLIWPDHDIVNYLFLPCKYPMDILAKHNLVACSQPSIKLDRTALLHLTCRQSICILHLSTSTNTCVINTLVRVKVLICASLHSSKDKMYILKSTEVKCKDVFLPLMTQYLFSSFKRKIGIELTKGLVRTLGSV